MGRQSCVDHPFRDPGNGGRECRSRIVGRDRLASSPYRVDAIADAGNCPPGMIDVGEQAAVPAAAMCEREER